jgi:hypothetical protein
LFITAENRKLRNVMTGMQLTQDVYPGAFSAWIIGSVLYGMRNMAVLCMILRKHAISLKCTGSLVIGRSVLLPNVDILLAHDSMRQRVHEDIGGAPAREAQDQ